MTQSNIDLTMHMGFQLSLLKLATIPGPNGILMNNGLLQEAQQLEMLVGNLATTQKRA